jgi:hypothetical protein
MTGSPTLSQPIELKDGRRLTSLDDARALMLGLPTRRRFNPYWEDAAELLMKARRRGGTPADIEALERKLARALKAEGLV